MQQIAALPEQRRARLVALLEADGWSRASQLATRLEVSVDTVRRDLDHLAAGGAVQRVRGGALATGTAQRAVEPPPLAERLAEGDTSRERRARAVAALLPADGLVVLCGGATRVRVARALGGPGPAVLTPSPPAALAAGGRCAEVRLTGGRLDARRGIVTGPEARMELERASADVVVVAPCAFDGAAGVMMHDREEADLVRAAVGRARRVVATVDASRLGVVATWAALDVDAVDVLVTDADADDPRLVGLRAEVVHA